MSIFDKLKQTAQAIKGEKEETFSALALPESVEEMKAMPESALETPYQTAFLTVCALCAYAADREIGKAMLNFLKGPQPLSNMDISFLNDRFVNQEYLPFSYFDGATCENDYTPAAPFRVTVRSNPHSFIQYDYATLYLTSGGADSPRPVTLRCKDGQWFLWQQQLMVGIRPPKSQNSWS